MRTLLFASAALLGLAAAPFVAHAASVTQPAAAPGVVVAQSTTLPPFTVTAPPAPRINDPAHISTWRFHAGPGEYSAKKGDAVGMGNGGGMKEGGFQSGS
jgi:ABC-type amino acid transport substrate-binding protein